MVQPNFKLYEGGIIKYQRSLTNATRYLLHFQITGLPQRTNEASKNSFMLLHLQRKRWKMTTVNLIYLLKPPRPLKKAKLTLTRFSSKRPDYDGLVSSFKPIVDGLVEAKILEDDNHDVIGIPKYDWQPAPLREGKIWVEVWEV